MLIILTLAGCRTRENKLAENSYNIITAPVSLVTGPGSFTFSRGSSLIVSPPMRDNATAAEFLASMIQKSTGNAIAVREGKKARRNSVFLAIDTVSGIAKEGYTLEVKKHRIIIKASTANGLFYGVQSLRQLMPAAIEKSNGKTDISTLTVPCCFIKDEPRFAYRGMHLDVCRHMLPLTR